MIEIIPVTKIGQIKEGDALLIDDGQKIIAKTCEEIVIDPNNGPEIIVDTKKNHYFIEKVYLEGKSWAKDVKIARRALGVE